MPAKPMASSNQFSQLAPLRLKPGQDSMLVASERPSGNPSEWCHLLTILAETGLHCTHPPGPIIRLYGLWEPNKEFRIRRGVPDLWDLKPNDRSWCNNSVLVTQLCPTLCDTMGCSLSVSSAHGILQARILEWVAIPFSTGSSWLRDWTCVSCKSLVLTGGFFTTCTTWETPGARRGCLRGRDTKLSKKFLPTVVPREIKFSVKLSVEFSRQEYWSGLPFPPPGNLPDPGIKPRSLRSPALAGRFFTTSTSGEPYFS